MSTLPSSETSDAAASQGEGASSAADAGALVPPAYVADTANPQATRIAKGRIAARLEAEFDSGPLPHPEILREFAEIYPDAPKLIFEDAHAQSVHRREIERSVIETKNKLALRGQIIGGSLGALGLIGSCVVVALGYGWAGATIALGDLVSLVGLFVYGQGMQRKERAEKEELRNRMQRGDAVEDIESGSSS